MNPAYSVESMLQLEATLIKAQQSEDAILREAAAIRQQTTAAAWAFHEMINGLKVQVEAQYGNDSPALYAVGRKRRSEHKRPTRQKKSAT
jgi:hypothetical protein